MLAGYETAEELAAVGAVLLDEKDIFPGESVQLHGMKVFAEKRIDEAILDAASVILSCKGLMSGVFLNMIGGNQRMLKKVDSIIYEDGMGISAWVDGKRVLIGGRELMQNVPAGILKPDIPGVGAKFYTFPIPGNYQLCLSSVIMEKSGQRNGWPL